MRKVQVLNITKNEIIIRKPTKLKNHLLIMSLVIIVSIMAIVSRESMSTIATSMTHVYNPVNSLYNDTSSIVFTSGLAIEKELLDFIIPIKSTNTNIDSTGVITFKVGNSIMVKSSESGIVESVGITNDGVKFIKIRHSLDISSLLEGVDIVGVGENEVIKKGQDIATAVEGSSVRFTILENNTPISNIKIHQSKIIWKDSK